MQKRLCKVGGIGIPKRNRVGWRDLREKMGGKALSEKPIGDPRVVYVLKDYTQSNMHTSKLKTSHSHNTFYKGEEIPIQDI